MGLRGTSLAAYAGLVAVGLFAASPFLCDRLVGTGEAYNYSLSVADAVSQMRSGVMPPLAGQTVYAFNGRIHPLRNAPYLYYMAAAVDQATRHTLGPWAIQNVCLTMSLIGAGLACYIGLRRGIDCPRLPSFLLSAVYALAPPLLSAAHSFDLFMTVHAAVFVPLAVAACVRGAVIPSFRADAWLAAMVAGAWLTHPPVALWLTAGVVLIRLLAFCRRPRWATLASGVCAAALAAALAAYVFASVAALNASTSSLTLAGAPSGLPPLVMANLRACFPAVLLPVTRNADSLTSLQFGYVAWVILGATAFRLLWRRRSQDAPSADARFTAAAALCFAGLLLTMAMPVPAVTPWIWRHMPEAVLELTTIWPMQRLYLVATAFTVIAAGLMAPKRQGKGKRRSWLRAGLVALAASWMLFEAGAYIGKGFRDRRPPGETADVYRPSNIDLTETSYAFFGLPGTYVAGVADPALEFRLLRNGTQEVASDMASASATGKEVLSASLRPDRQVILTLAPGKRYLLTFAFRTAPLNGLLYLNGSSLRRNYSLPSAGGPAAFGMNGGQPRSLPIWTDLHKPELVTVLVHVPGLDTPAGRSLVFADLTLIEIAPERLPVRLLSLSPLRFAVTAPEEGLTVETPRRFIEGYEAIVNGRKIRPLMSPDRQVMVRIPAGESVVRLECTGPRYVVVAFWISAYSWLAFLAWQFTGARVPSRLLGKVTRAPRGAAVFVWRHKALSLGIVACALAVLFELRQQRRRHAALAAVGPVSIDFMLPYGQLGLSQPLLSTGKPGAGAVVFVHYIDASHVQIGADIWGGLYLGPPVEVDYSKVQNLVVSDSALFPVDNPAVAALAPSELAGLRGEVKVELNGETVIRVKRFAYETQPSELKVGHTEFVSASNPDFLGEILDVQRLLVPRTMTLPGGRHAHLSVRFPDDKVGSSEPLVSVTRGNSVRECYANYLSAGRLRITCWSPGVAVTRSAVVTYDPSVGHALDISVGDRAGGVGDLDLGCQFDGNPLFGADQESLPGLPSVVVTASNQFHAAGVDGRFTGSQMDLSSVPDVAKAGPGESSGPVHMVVVFPSDKGARQEPLLTAGHTGAGDLFYVVYVDAAHVRIGYDHWGVGGVVSEPIALDYGAPHEFWITMGSLGTAAGRSSHHPTLVLLDGRTVVSSPLVPYPALPSEVTVGLNKIGASTADPEFTGVVQFVERTGSTSFPTGRPPVE